MCQCMMFLKKVRGRFAWKNVVNYHSDIWLFVLTVLEPILAWCLYQLISLWNETLICCSYKQAWTLLRSGFLRLLKFWKQFHANQHITESRRKNVWKEFTAMFKFFCYWKLTNNFNNDWLTACDGFYDASACWLSHMKH